jgi:hypothetical protein
VDGKIYFLDVCISGDEAENTKLSEMEREAWRLYRNALEATNNLFELYKSDSAMFQKIAEQMMFLPSFLSWHPANERFNRHLLVFSRLNQKNEETTCIPKPHHLARQSWPTRFAYAILETIILTMDTYEERLPLWAEIYGYGVKHPIPYKQNMARQGDRRFYRCGTPRLGYTRRSQRPGWQLN